MALFKKNQTTTTNIPELQEYYANQQKESAGKAWLLAIGSLLITIVVLVSAFFGGRWVYRKLTKKDVKKAVVTSQTDTSDSNTSTTPKPTSSSTNSTSTTTSTPSTTSTTKTPTTTTPAQGVATTQTTATNTSAVAASTTSTALPDTGPGDTIGLFIAIMAVAYFAHRAHLVRKLNK